MKSVRFFLTIGCWMLFFFIAFGQGNISVTKPSANPIPPTPNAAAFQKYGDIPVSLNTGVPNISVPITSIELKEFSWPINMSYHASGFKSEDVSSNVGLGWVINAAGVITAKQSLLSGGVKMNELRNLDLRTGVTLDPECQYINPNDMDLAERYSTGEFSQSPDFYQLNAGQLSARFIYADGEGHSLPYNDIKITSQGYSQNVPDTWMVKDTDGNRFEFDLRGYNYKGSDCQNGFPTMTINPVYYLTRIHTRYGEMIHFYYDDEVYSYRTPDLIITKTVDPAQPQGYCNFPQTEITNCINNQTAHEKRLTRIESSRGDIIRFYYAERMDLPGSSRLNVIRRIWKDNNGIEKILSETVLQQNYFGTGTDSYGLHLKLDGICTYSNDQVTSPVQHSFEYTTGDLPHKLSQSISFNGSNPVQPSALYNITTAGLLSKIVYPTGGYSTFLFEALPSLGQTRILELKSFGRDGDLSGFKKYQYHDALPTQIVTPFTEQESTFFWGNPSTGGSLSTVNEGNYCAYFPGIHELILECRRIVRKSTPILSTVKELAEAGNYFQHITEFFGANGENGKIEYEFGNGITTGVRVHDDIGYLLLKNDKLVSKKVFSKLTTGGYELKSEEISEYAVADDNDPSFYAGNPNNNKEHRFWIKKIQKVRDDMKLSCPSNGHFCFHKVFNEVNYRITSLPVELRKQILKRYEQGQLSSEVTSFFYESPHHSFVTKIESNNSKGEAFHKLLKYAPDILGNTVFQSMVAKNQIGAVVEDRMVKVPGNQELSKTELVFGSFNNGSHYLPIEVKSSVMGNTTETEMVFEQYDALGNLLSVKDKSGVPTSFVWAYGSHYPVAKISGATYTTVQSYINPISLKDIYDGASLESGLATLRNIPNSLTTIHTYQPGVGMMTSLDPRGMKTSYEYDGSGRLAVIRDQTGNVVKKFCYNYANEAVECTDNIVYTTLSMAFKNNTEYSGSFSKACGIYTSGAPVTYSVPAGTVISYISQQDANTKAQQKMQLLGQAYANIHGSCSVQPSTIYAVISVENLVVGGTSTYGDVVLRFYSDAAHSIPVVVNGLSVKFRERQHDNMNGMVYDNEFTVSANGSIFLALPGVELTSNDGWLTDWWKEFTLLTNPGYTF